MLVLESDRQKASLHRDSGDEGMESTIQLRKELIGKGCLQRMLAYFTDMKKDASDGLMRRWVSAPATVKNSG